MESRSHSVTTKMLVLFLCSDYLMLKESANQHSWFHRHVWALLTQEIESEGQASPKSPGVESSV